METLDALLEREQLDRARHLQYLADIRRQHAGTAEVDTEGEIEFDLSQKQVAWRNKCDEVRSDGTDSETDDHLTGKVSYDTDADSVHSGHCLLNKRGWLQPSLYVNMPPPALHSTPEVLSPIPACDITSKVSGKESGDEETVRLLELLYNRSTRMAQELTNPKAGSMHSRAKGARELVSTSESETSGDDGSSGEDDLFSGYSRHAHMGSSTAHKTSSGASYTAPGPSPSELERMNEIARENGRLCDEMRAMSKKLHA
ncbi:MAG: hypothetical protein GY702_26190, partial [Desulfobulbaceae bacterium]|nr:hypothetical protein [Desulfobulbaceae bacterium]